MEQDEKATLEARLARLEAEVAELRRRLEPAGSPAPRPPRPAPPPGRTSPPHRRAGTSPAARLFEEGRWLDKLGIALLLFGVVLLFRYSIEQGWLGPPVRLAGGFLLGFALLASGRRLPPSRRTLARVLTGGAVATFYIALYAGFQRYALLSHGVAFAGMVATTALAFALAIRDDEAVHSLVGSIGGFATPFLLDTGDGDVAALVVYASLVLAGAAAVYAVQGWRVLLGTATAGAWLVLGIACTWEEREAAVQAGIVFAALVAWWLPLGREALAAREPGQLRALSLGLAVRVPERLRWPHPQGLLLTTALVSHGLTAVLWDMEESAAGALALALAALWLAGAALTGAHLPLRSHAATHGIAAALLAVLGTTLLLDGDALRVALAGEAWALHALARQREAAGPRLLGHALLAALGLWWLGELGGGLPERSLLDPAAWSELFPVVAVGSASALLRGEAKSAYRVAAHVAFLVWLLRELGDAANGQALVSLAWTAYAVTLLALGLRGRAPSLRRAALATFLAIAAKLFLVDLRAVDVLWRIASFLGLGLVLLGLSYRFAEVWSEAGSDDATRQAQESPEDG